MHHKLYIGGIYPLSWIFLQKEELVIHKPLKRNAQSVFSLVWLLVQ